MLSFTLEISLVADSFPAVSSAGQVDERVDGADGLAATCRRGAFFFDPMGSCGESVSLLVFVDGDDAIFPALVMVKFPTEHDARRRHEERSTIVFRRSDAIVAVVLGGAQQCTASPHRAERSMSIPAWTYAIRKISGTDQPIFSTPERRLIELKTLNNCMNVDKTKKD